MFGHELLSIIFREAQILLSTLDPSSLAYGIAALFESLTQKIRPDGHQAIFIRLALNLAGAAGHDSPAQRVPGSAVRIPPGDYQIQQNPSSRLGFGIWCAELELVRHQCTVWI
jgi:hypothetical protein